MAIQRETTYQRLSLLFAAGLLFFFCEIGQATADPVDTSSSWSMGARVGGYGFRERTSPDVMEKSGTGWQACRMNGLGVFVGKTLSRVFFVEGGLDTYFTDSFPTGEAVGNYDTPIDRNSALLSISGGARFFADKRVSPYLQLGLGAELTKASLPAVGLEDSAVLPLGFFGVGADVSVSSKLRVGASLRVNAMGYYDDAQFQTEMSPEAELATQGQFYAAFAL